MAEAVGVAQTAKTRRLDYDSLQERVASAATSAPTLGAGPRSAFLELPTPVLFVCKEVLREDPFCGAVFVFRNRRRTAIKALVYDGQVFGDMTLQRHGWRRAWPGKIATDVTSARDMVQSPDGADPRAGDAP